MFNLSDGDILFGESACGTLVSGLFVHACLSLYSLDNHGTVTYEERFTVVQFYFSTAYKEMQNLWTHLAFEKM